MGRGVHAGKGPALMIFSATMQWDMFRRFGLRALILAILLGFVGASACIVRTRPAQHRVYVKSGHPQHKKYKKPKKHKKYKKRHHDQRDHRDHH